MDTLDREPRTPTAGLAASSRRQTRGRRDDAPAVAGRDAPAPSSTMQSPQGDGAQSPRPAAGQLTAVSLFAGIGGIDLALERAGIKVVAAVEIDPACVDVLAKHFTCQLFEDVTEVTGDQLVTAGFDPGAGIIAAGWPCQGNSVAGRRGGLGDPRSGLWTHVVRLLAETRAAWFLGENVPGLYTVNQGADITVVRSDLARLGYWHAERILDAQFFGVPQRLRRIYFAGRLGDRAAPVEVLLEPEGRDGDLAPVGQARTRPPAGPERSVARTVTSHHGRSDADTFIASTLQAGGQRGHRVDAEGAAGGQLVAFSENQRGEVVTSDVAYTVKGGGGKPGQGYPAVAHALTDEGADASEDGTGRGMPIVTTGMVRRLTPLECERLQGFPDRWTEYGLSGRKQSDSVRYRQVGNAVAVPVVEWIARRLAAVEAAR